MRMVCRRAVLNPDSRKNYGSHGAGKAVCFAEQKKADQRLVVRKVELQSDTLSHLLGWKVTFTALKPA